MSGGGVRRGRRLLPALIALPFAVALAYDLVRLVTEAPLADLELLEVSELRFEPADPVFDLRAGRLAGPSAWSEPALRLVEGWGETADAGSWTTGGTATVELDLAGDDLSVLFVEARADRRRREPLVLAVTINGTDCGSSTIGRRLAPLRFTVPGGVLRRGSNLVELHALGRQGGRPDEVRTLLVRRLVLAGTGGAVFEDLAAGPALAVDRERQIVTIRKAGRLVAPFETPSSGSVVSLRLRFAGPRPQGRCRVVVARRFESPARFDVVSDRELDAARARSRRVRQEIPGRGEPSALLVEVDREAAAGGVVLSELMLEPRTRDDGTP